MIMWAGASLGRRGTNSTTSCIPFKSRVGKVATLEVAVFDHDLGERSDFEGWVKILGTC